MQADKNRSEAEDDAEEKRVEMERRKDEVTADQTQVEDSVTKAKDEFGLLKTSLHSSAARLDRAFWWLDVAAWAVPIGVFLIYFGAFAYYQLPIDPYVYFGIVVVLPTALFLRLLVWQVRLQASGEDISFIQSVKESFHSLPLRRFKLGFRPTKFDEKVSEVWTQTSTLTKAAQRYVPGVKDYYEGQDLVRKEKDFIVTLRNALAEYGLMRNESVETYLPSFGPPTGEAQDWIRKAASDLTKVSGVPPEIIKFVYADYIADDPAKRDNWKAITGNQKTFRSFVEVLLNSGKLPGDYHEENLSTYGGIEEVMLKTIPFNLSSFLDSYYIQYYEYAAEKESLLAAVKTYRVKTSPSKEASIRSLVPPTFGKEQRLNALFAKAESLFEVEGTILRLIFYEREAISAKRANVWSAMMRGESQLPNHTPSLPKTTSRRGKVMRHFASILKDGSLLDIPTEYSRFETVEYIVRALSALPDFTLPAAKSEVRQAFNSLKEEKDSLIRTLAANNIPLGEGERKDFDKLLPIGDSLNTLIASLEQFTKVKGYVILLLYCDFTAQLRKRDDHFLEIKGKPDRLSYLADVLLNQKLVSASSRSENELGENVSNLTAYMSTIRTFSKTDIDSTFSDYGKLFQYTKGVFRFMVEQKVCKDTPGSEFGTVLDQVPHPEADFFDNLVKVAITQITSFSEITLASDWIEPVALAATTAFLVTKDDAFLGDAACRRTSNDTRAVKILYDYSCMADEEQHKSQRDRTPFAEIVKQTIGGKNPRTEYLPDFQRGLKGGYLYRRISDIPATRLRRIEDQVTKAVSELDFKKKLDAHLQALATFLRSQLKSGVIMESLRMQLVTAYAITVPTRADVISGVIENRLPNVCQELTKTEPDYKDLFIEIEANQPKIGMYTRLGVVPFKMTFNEFSEKFRRAYRIAVQQYSDTGSMPKPLEEYVANVIRIFPTDAYFKQLEPPSSAKSKSAEDLLTALIEPIMLTKFGEVKTAEILASLHAVEEDQVAMRAVLAALYDTEGALYLISKDLYDAVLVSPTLTELVVNGRFDSDLADSFGKKSLSDLALTIYGTAQVSNEDRSSIQSKLTKSIEQIRTLTRAHANHTEIQGISRVTFQSLYDVGMILSGF